MATKNPRAKWVLPLVVDPTERLCAVVPVPNDVYHIAAFRGAMLGLASAYKWGDDLAHTAKDVANVWRDIAENVVIGECLLPTQYRMLECGDLEFSVDGGATWEQLADFSGCFLWRLPDSEARNSVQSTGNFPTMTFKRGALQSTAHMQQFKDNSNVLQAWIDRSFAFKTRGVFNLNNGMFLGRNFLGFGMEQTEGNGFQSINSGQHGYGWHFNPVSAFDLRLYGLTAAGALKTLMTVSVSASDAFHYWDVKGQWTRNGAPGYDDTMFQTSLSSRATAGYILVSGQSQPLINYRDAVGNVVSGVDKYAYNFMRLTSGAPAQTDAKNGAVAADTTNHTLWVSFAGVWYQLGAQGVPGVPGVLDTALEIVACDDAPELTLNDGTLTLKLPATQCPPEPEITRFYHRERDRPLPGGQDYVEFLVQAREHVVLPWQLVDGDTLLVSIMDGWWDDTPYNTLGHKPGFPGYEGDGRVMFTGLPGTFVNVPTDPAPLENHMAVLTCYTQIGSIFTYMAGNGPLNIENIDTAAAYAWLMPNTDADFRYGAQHVVVHITAAAPIDLCATYGHDFSVNTGGWHIVGIGEQPNEDSETYGLYVNTVGFETTIDTTHKILFKPSVITQVDGEKQLSFYMTMKRTYDPVFSYSACSLRYKKNGVWYATGGLQIYPTLDYTELYCGLVPIGAGQTLTDIAIYIDTNHTDKITIKDIRIGCT